MQETLRRRTDKVQILSVECDGHAPSPDNPYNDMRETDSGDVYPLLVAELDRPGAAYVHVDGGGGEPVKARRGHFRGTIVTNGVPGGAPTGREAAETALANGADLVAFGRVFLANPDLPVRLALDAEPYAVDYTTAHGGDRHGYSDYPALTNAAV